MYASIGDALLWEENSMKLSGLFIDSKLSFDIQVQKVCKKASQKLTANIPSSPSGFLAHSLEGTVVSHSLKPIELTRTRRNACIITAQ